MEESAQNTTQEAPLCPLTGSQTFNYCLWGKIIVAIPALPLLSLLAASMFTHVLAQIAAAAIVCGGGVYLLEKMDELPLFARKIVPPKS